MKKLICGAFVVAFICLPGISPTASAGIPQMINYQGKLTAVTGNLVASGQYNMTFAIYDAETGGTLKWAETWDSPPFQVQVTNGIFNVLLGSKTAIGLDFSENYWLEMQVDDGGTYETLLPRQQLVSTGYAFRADKVTDGAITDASISGSAAIADTKLATISTAGKVSGASVSGSIAGNAATATKLAATKNINGVAFDGSADITVPSDIAAGSSGNVLTSNGTTWTSTVPAFTGAPSSTDNAIARFDGTTGKSVQNSLLFVTDAGEIQPPIKSGPGRSVAVKGGDSSDDDGGLLYLQGGTATAGNKAGGPADLISGDGSGSGAAGYVLAKGGTGGATGGGGMVIVQGGAGGATSGEGGTLYLRGGNATNGDSPGGNILLYPGNKRGSAAIGHITLFPYDGASYAAVFNLDSIASSDKTFTFPNQSGTLALTSDIAAGASPPGVISPYAGSTAPTGWLLCDGATVSRTTYAALFAVIGHTYGADPGGGNFILPNLKGKIPAGYSASETEFNALAKTGGEKTHQLTVDELATHQHGIGGGGSSSYGEASGSFTGNPSLWTSPAGSNTPHNNLQPYVTLNYIIKI